jgi:hypothetical protein
VKKQIINEKPAIDKEKILPTAKRLAKRVALACPRFLINGKVRLGERSGSYSNSEQTELAFKNSNLSISFQVKDKDSSNIADVYYGTSVGRYGKSVEDKIVADVKMLHDNFFTEKIVLPDGEYPVILEPYDICGHIFKDFIAEYYVSGGSLFSGKLGETIFNENLSVCIDRNPKTNRSSAFYDAEGEIAKDYRAPLIENGKFKIEPANSFSVPKDRVKAEMEKFNFNSQTNGDEKIYTLSFKRESLNMSNNEPFRLAVYREGEIESTLVKATKYYGVQLIRSLLFPEHYCFFVKE